MESDNEPIEYGSVCSGIEAASVAWHPLGWVPAWFAEIEPFPCAVLAHRFPSVPNLGDMTAIADRIRAGEVKAPEVLVGGTPCQAFSVAGARAGLADPRGQLTLSYVDLANAIDSARAIRGEQPCVTVWENVPGVLSSKDNAFGCFLGALAGESSELQPPGGKWRNAGCVFGPQRAIAWRVLDAQYFGLAQRRRRVFVVASARERFDPASVLFESEGVRRDSAPRREAGQDVAGSITASLGRRGGVPDCGSTAGQLHPVGFRMAAFGEYSDDGSASTMKARDYKDATDLVVHPTICVHGTQDPDIRIDHAHTLGRNNGMENAVLAPEVCITGDITHTLKADGFDGSEDSTGRGQPIVSVAHVHVCPTIRAGGNQTGGDRPMGTDVDTADSLLTHGQAVRRLTPRECERLQGFEDDWTAVPFGRVIKAEKMDRDFAKYLMRGGRMNFEQCCQAAADGPRYKAIGNSKAVPVVRWLGRRIAKSMRASA